MEQTDCKLRLFLKLACVAVLIGIIAGFGAVLFRYLIGFIHNLSFLGEFNFNYDANIHTKTSPLGFGIIFVPVIGAVLVAYLVKNFAPEAKGHGVPEVMEAMYFRDSVIRPSVAFVKAIASAISIGTGGSVGREGPIVQIGSTFGSIIGSLVKITPAQRAVLVAAGAAGGISATFNTPIGALAFAIELMLLTATAANICTVAITITVATYIGKIFLGSTPAFFVESLALPDFKILPFPELFSFVILGIFLGFVSIVFIRGLYWSEDMFDKMPGNYYTRHMLGMLCMGLLIYTVFQFAGNYYIQGVGYATIADILKNILTNPGLLFLLVILKLLATFLTLGSGGSGGVFSPVLFIGACFGAGVGLLVKMLFPEISVEVVLFAIAGMAAMVAGTTGAVLTSIIMLIEMTNDMHVALPLILTSTISYFVRKHFLAQSIYTLKLSRRGTKLPENLLKM